MVQEVQISGDIFWRVRDKLGRHIRTCLSGEEADKEVAIWDIVIDEMQGSTDAVGLLRVKARGLAPDGHVAANHVGYLCASKLDDDAMTEMTRSRMKAEQDLSHMEVGAPTPGR